MHEKEFPRANGKTVARKRLTQDEVDLLADYRGVKNVASQTGVPIEDIDFYWDKSSPDYSVNVKNRFYRKREGQDITEVDFSKIFAKKIKPVKVKKKKKRAGLFDRLVFSDVHIGMNPNPDGYSLYGGKWDAEELDRRLEIMVNHVVSYQSSNVLYIDDLGDLMDGWDQQTTRKGHILPQNMDNQEAFDTGVRFKIKMIDAFFKHFDKIYCHNVCEDNHSGAFGYNVNSAFKTYIEMKYGNNIEVTNQRKFIDYYKVEDFIFILTHGKDSKDMKFGFKPVLDPKQITKIRNFISEHHLYTEDVIIEFSKGDSHQYLFDNSSSDIFNYYNYPSLAPSSGYIQTNFQKGISGFVSFNYYRDQQKRINEHLFKWNS